VIVYVEVGAVEVDRPQAVEAVEEALVFDAPYATKVS